MTTWTPDQLLFINDRARATKNEILLPLMLAQPFYPGGKTPTLLTIKTMGAVHDFCDANTLGGWCDDAGFIAMRRDYLFPAQPQDDKDGALWLDAASECQDILNEWIQRGNMLADVEFLALWLDTEQLECLLDEDRWVEAHWMIDDMSSRMAEAFTCRRLRRFLPEQPQWMREHPHLAEDDDMVGITRSISPRWIDQSWHNDASARWEMRIPGGPFYYQLWIEAKNPNSREATDMARFVLCKSTDEHSEIVEMILETEEWPRVLDKMAELEALTPLVVVDTTKDLLRELRKVAMLDPDSSMTSAEFTNLMQRIHNHLL